MSWRPTRTQRVMGWRHWPNLLAGIAIIAGLIAMYFVPVGPS